MRHVNESGDRFNHYIYLNYRFVDKTYEIQNKLNDINEKKCISFIWSTNR